MSTLTFQLTEVQADRLAAAAREVGVPVEELLRKLTDEFLERKNSFDDAAKYVLKKNAELYRRLAVTHQRSSLDKLLARITDENKHAETETGPVVGQEVW